LVSVPLYELSDGMWTCLNNEANDDQKFSKRQALRLFPSTALKSVAAGLRRRPSEPSPCNYNMLM